VWLKLDLSRSTPAGRQRARRGAVIAQVPADELVFAWVSRLLEVLPHKLQAASIASDPPLKGFTYFRFPGVTLPSFAMKSNVTSAIPCKGGANVIVSICLRIASSKRGCHAPRRPMQDQGIAGEFRHLVEVDECSFQQLLLTEIHFHFTLSRLGFRGKVTRRTKSRRRPACPPFPTGNRH
jgi:hypothetical protein